MIRLKLTELIKEKLKLYKAKNNGLGRRIKPLLGNLDLEKTIPCLRRHSYRVALLSDETANRLMQNSELAFFSGLLHDIGKTAMDPNLFDGHPVSDQEYAIIKTHAELGAKMVEPYDKFVSLIVGWSHLFCANGYGSSLEKAIKKFSVLEIKNAINIASIVAICDCIDANVNRKTEWKGLENGTMLSTLTLNLREKFLDEELKIQIAIESFIRLDFDREKK